MTLAEIIATFPDLFYRNNRDWFDREEFMHIEPVPINEWFWASDTPLSSQRQIRAVDLAAVYVRHPERELWQWFLWTDDIDRYGNRVYVGGVGAYGIDAFQIHRHIMPVCYWVSAA